MSHYPVIISIENHCNEAQQARMAKVFREEFQNELGQCIVATENILDGTDRPRLPSPNELQGMILLKGSYKNVRAVLSCDCHDLLDVLIFFLL